MEFGKSSFRRYVFFISRRMSVASSFTSFRRFGASNDFYLGECQSARVCAWRNGVNATALYVIAFSTHSRITRGRAVILDRSRNRGKERGGWKERRQELRQQLPSFTRQLLKPRAAKNLANQIYKANCNKVESGVCTRRASPFLPSLPLRSLASDFARHLTLIRITLKRRRGLQILRATCGETARKPRLISLLY